MTRKHHGLLRLVRPQILHFAGPEKPWTAAGQQVQHRAIRAAYAAFLEARYPERAFALAGQTKWSRRLSQEVVALWVWAELRPFLRRFRSPLDVVVPAHISPRTGDRRCAPHLPCQGLDRGHEDAL
jgi:hypothetical protein